MENRSEAIPALSILPPFSPHFIVEIQLGGAPCVPDITPSLMSYCLHDFPNCSACAVIFHIEQYNNQIRSIVKPYSEALNEIISVGDC